MSTATANAHFSETPVSPHSRASVFLKPLRVDPNGEVLCSSSASGFLWRSAKCIFLVTNYHVASGFNPDTRFQIGTFLPNAMDIEFFVESSISASDTPNHHLLERVRKRIYWDDANFDQVWRLHHNGPTTDVAAFPLAWEQNDTLPICLNQTGLDLSYQTEIGEDVFVVGYPEGRNFEHGLPIWKRGTIATEPGLNQLGQGQIYIDSIGNEGLSGSPVLVKRNIALIGDASGRTRFKYSLVGIYAGRLGRDGLESQLCRVFKREKLLELLTN